ncbi:DEAD/DEAH box helicase [Archangium violaceum]|uniref:DEAD/DEAH box helicase n=1 Tax=Archangium violaceum TaxID=83451 RepID=UPI001EF0BB9B|nr:DEAD/DEAH box helicase [Archangium violaceum]
MGVGEGLLSWFRSQGWAPFPFQLQAWEAYSLGQSGLIHVPTGAGKTYAAYIGPLSEVAHHRQKGLQILYVTPLRAVSRDIELALNAPLSALDVDLTVESRTGDTSSSVRRRQRERLPEVLITTPESLSLLLCNERAHELFATLRCVIVDEWHELLGVLALHHGSIDREARERVERGLKDGSVRLVVCTSSLDLGVDFGPVERVVQVGSPKGIARTLQRAGRSAHRPGATAHLLFVPTHALELVEMAAAREALAHREVEPRAPLRQPLDVLAQHLVTCALGGGFTRDKLFSEVRDTLAYQDLSEEDFDRTLLLVTEGGPTLRAYPQFRRVQRLEDRYVVADARMARLHRLNVGTIASDATVELRYLKGARLGTVEESFVSRLRPGDTFLFAGKRLEFRLMKDLTAYVKAAKERASATPRWSGGRLPLSGSLAAAVRRAFHAAREGRLDTAELEAARPVLEAQARLSRLPSQDACLAELCQSREGHHLFLYPFEGRLVHEGLAALLALRLTRLRKATFSLAVNDYGLELLTPSPFPFEEALRPALFTREWLVEDILESVNLGELARRQFRDVARVAGLVMPGLPGARKSTRQVQASAGLLYDVFARYEPDHLLLSQARREVLEQHFEQVRLVRTLERLERSPLECIHVPRPTPLGFPLVIERIGATLSNESLVDRVERMKEKWLREDSLSA